MPWLYGQTWLWYLIAFLVGVLLAWLLLVRPQQRRLDALQQRKAATVAPAAAVREADPVTEEFEPVTEQFEPVTGQIAAVDPALSTLDSAKSARDETVVIDDTAEVAAAEVAAAADAPAATHDGPTAPVAGEDGRATGGVSSGEGATAVPKPGDAAAAGGAVPVAARSDEPAGGSTEAQPDDRLDGSDVAATAQDSPLAPAATGALGIAGLAAAGATSEATADPPYGPGSARPNADGSSPHADYAIKGNADSMLYHAPESPYYVRTRAEAWFATAEAAQAAGFQPWNRNRKRAAVQGLAEPAPTFEPGAYAGSAKPRSDGSAPTDAFTIKGNEDSMLYHLPSSPYYGRTRAEVWFATEADAEAAGFRQYRRK